MLSRNGLTVMVVSAIAASFVLSIVKSDTADAIAAVPFNGLQAASLDARKKRRREPMTCHTMAVTRTFLSVSADQLGWNEESWYQRFTDLRQLGFSEVILTYSSTDDIELFARSMPDKIQHSPIGVITRAAASTRMKIWLGLHRENSPASYQGRDVSELATALASRLEKIEDRLYPLVLSTLSADPNQKVYRGWYVPDVINSAEWIDPDRNKQYAQYLSGLRSMLNRLQPTWPIMLSATLDQADVAPDELISAWRQLTDFAGANVFLFELSQSVDGFEPIQAKKSPSDWLELVSRELEREDLSVGATIRLFYRLNDDRVRATSFTHLREALGTIRHYGREPLTVQPIPRHLLDEKDWSSINLRKRWIRDQKACRGTPSKLVNIVPMAPVAKTVTAEVRPVQKLLIDQS